MPSVKHTHREEVQYPDSERYYREYAHEHEFNATAHLHEYAWTGSTSSKTLEIPMNRGRCRLTSIQTQELFG